jgi:hypothetical protein
MDSFGKLAPTGFVLVPRNVCIQSRPPRGLRLFTQQTCLGPFFATKRARIVDTTSLFAAHLLTTTHAAAAEASVKSLLLLRCLLATNPNAIRL